MKTINELNKKRKVKYRWQEPGFDLEKERKKMAIMTKRLKLLVDYVEAEVERKNAKKN
jgi:hypothetical protein